MEHFGNRSTQAQQHVYTTTPYNLYPSQPPYIAGYQAVPQHHPVTFQQGSSHYSRPSVGAGPETFTEIANNVQQRQGGHEVGGNGISRSSGIHQGSVPSGSITHQGMHQSGTVAADGPHSIAQGNAPLAASLTAHHCLPSSQNMPLRIVVDARYVGAIIGQGGSSIREITKESKARCVVDVQKAGARDLNKNTEKVISILGQPEGCSKACVKILEVVRKEMEKDNTIAQHPDIELKIRAHNQLVGRLIGKGGATIKKIMEETGAHIYVSNNLSEPTLTHDEYALMPPYAASSLYGSDMSLHLERTVTVKASTMSIVSAAEQKISQKLRLSFEADMNSRMMFSSSSAAATIPLMTAVGEAGFLSAAAGVPPAHYARNAVGTTAAASQQQVRTVHMWVPNNMVGALIGAKGVHIRSAIRLTGAQVRIEGGGTNKDKKESKGEGNNEKMDKENITANDSVKKETVGRDNEPSNDEGNSDGKQNGKKEENVEKAASPKLAKDKDVHADERLVTITGNEPQQYKAQFWIYQRIAEQSYHYMDEVRLCTEIPVPSRLVGRIIGKGGQNVRELQRMTGAQVKIPDDAGDDEARKATTVRVLGNFQSSQAVQARLGQLMNDFSQRLNIGSSNGQSASRTQGSSPGIPQSQW